ncbi:MAG: peptidase M22 [Peptostreptococcaceae bacterium]|nr:peptidase M22 [Peptostreptococcaceae bacterium]
MKSYSLGIDTSCYTTSLAIVDAHGEVLVDERIPLNVGDGQKGLRQSEAFYQHVLNLPGLFEKVATYADGVACISVSEKPRNNCDSYMPVFNAGTAFARAVSNLLALPIHYCSHQEGHIYSVMKESGINADLPFVAVHLSGGTAEIMNISVNGNRVESTIIGGSLDITAGQLIDRVGVMLGYAFPAGKALDGLVCESKDKSAYRTSVKNGYFNLSGIENMSEKDFADGVEPVEIIVKTFNCIANTLLEAFAQLDIANRVILMTGGVSASRFLKKALSRELKSIRFGPSGLCTDNAVGLARMGIGLSGVK